MRAHPVHDLREDQILSARVAKQIEQLDRWFRSLNHVIESLVGFVNPVVGHVIVDVLNLFAVKLVMEPFKGVSKVYLRLDLLTRLWVFLLGTLPLFLFRIRRAVLLFSIVPRLDLLLIVRVQGVLQSVVHSELGRVHEFLPRVLLL